MGSTNAFVERIMKRSLTAPTAPIGQTHFGRNAVGARVGTEVRVETTVLLHDNHDVLDLVDAFKRRCIHAWAERK